MSRIMLSVEYDGTRYAGWQRQSNGLAVQQVLEEALSTACGHCIQVTGSSRTDAGVHALDQRVHFDTDCSIPPDKYPFVLNNLLPPDIRVQSGQQVPEHFHARFLTCGKTYTYRIINKRHGSALLHGTHLHVPLPLDEAPMQQTLPSLMGTHDFAAFQASGGTAKTTVRTIQQAQLTHEGDRFIFTVTGNAFLYNMVRIIVGSLVEVGLHKRAPDCFTKAFASLNRLDLGMTVPPQGLELTKVYYPPEAFTDPEAIRWHQEEVQNAETE